MIENVKTLLAIIAAALAGIVVGIWYTVQLSDPVVLGQRPQWIGQAELVYMLSTAGAATATIAWGYVDYKYVVKS